MKELFIYMVNELTIAEILSKIKADIAKYEASPTDENLKALELSTCMFTTKGSLRSQKPEQLIDKMQKMHKGAEFLTPKQN